ncbi:MAG: hypothetical protein I8H75_04455 [Myxococcaceae bacterium]|nr:hypothetical protein [Myxococcaceae bacterium]MBH2006575.1 hypothetical protein [Myxococcaceae bacterium]
MNVRLIFGNGNEMRVLFLVLFHVAATGFYSPVALLPHQQAPIDYLLKHPEIKGLLVNHYMGTGKTFLAIGFAEQFQDKPVIILAPRFIEGHWRNQMSQFRVAHPNRYEFVSYNDAPEKLKNRDLSNTILLMDEAHNLLRLIQSVDLQQNQDYSQLYIQLRQCHRILALTGTPIYSAEYDLAPLLNLVSGKELLPFNEEEFRLKYTEVNPGPSFLRGYLSESMILRGASPIMLAFAGAGLFGYVGIPAVFTVGMIASPVFNSVLLPLEKYKLRRLNVEELKAVTQDYISFYEIPNQDRSQFPSQERHIREVNYDSYQFKFFLDFAEMALDDDRLRMLLKEHRPNLDATYAKMNSTLLQKQLRNAPGAGRDIGNLGDEPSKFKEILKVIQKGPFEKTVVYSNYFENGILTFSRYLDQHGLKDKYQILRPDASTEEQLRIVSNYNSGDIPILLLHPEITEGISLKGTRQFHIMEPVLNSTVLEQVVARAIRYQSHADLPAQQRKVDVYLWKVMLGGFNLKNFEIGKKNWLKRYRELSDWSDFGRGLIQVDKNYYFKMYSPDEYTYIRLGDLSANVRRFKEVLEDHSIEKPIDLSLLSKPRESIVSQIYPAAVLTMSYLFNPQIHWLGNQELKTMPVMESTTSYRAGIEVPLFRYLNAGGHVQYTAYSFPRQESSLVMLGTGLDVKTQVPIVFKNQRIAPYLLASLGINGIIDTGALREYSEARSSTGKRQNETSIFGLGPEGSIATGIEYYPVPLLGIFMEGGVRGLIGLHRIEDRIENITTWDFRSYSLYAWKLQAGLRLGF